MCEPCLLLSRRMDSYTMHCLNKREKRSLVISCCHITVVVNSVKRLSPVNVAFLCRNKIAERERSVHSQTPIQVSHHHG